MGDAWVQFRIRYYMFALVFVVFDVETVLLYPWAMIFDVLGVSFFIEALIFMLILIGIYFKNLFHLLILFLTLFCPWLFL